VNRAKKTRTDDEESEPPFAFRDKRIGLDFPNITKKLPRIGQTFLNIGKRVRHVPKAFLKVDDGETMVV